MHCWRRSVSQLRRLGVSSKLVTELYQNRLRRDTAGAIYQTHSSGITIRGLRTWYCFRSRFVFTRVRFPAAQKSASKLLEKLEEQAYLRYGRERVSFGNERLAVLYS